MASEPMSLNDFPNEILLKILSYFESDDLFILAKVCERWNVLAKDVILWKSVSYYCDDSSDISRIAQVRCYSYSLGLISLQIFPMTCFKSKNLKVLFGNWASFRPEVRQVARGLHYVTPSGCYW